MKNGFRILDADAHVVYPANLWSRFLDEPHRSRVSSMQPIPGWDQYNPTTVDGRWTQHDTILYGQFQGLIGWTKEDMIAKYGPMISEGFTGDRVAEALAVDGIDLAVIYGPEWDLWFEGIDPELQAAMARAYNRWGQEMTETSGGRVRVASPVPLLDVSRAVQEITYAHDELGVRAFWARTYPQNLRTLGDRYYDPIWELLQDLDVPFATHEFMGLRGSTFGSDRFRTYIEWHAAVHQWEAMGAMMSMIVHGVFERFPRLRVAYLEAGCGWVPQWLHRVEEQLEHAGAEVDALSMSATDYFQRNCWVTTECEDPFVADAIRWLGDEHILFESDFPHPDSKYPNTTEEFLELLPDEISVESKRKIMWDNAIDFYRFPADWIPEPAADVDASAG